MTRTIIAIFAILASSQAFALDPYSRNELHPSASNVVEKGIQVYNPNTNANERVGVGCNLYINYKKIHEGYCRVGRRDSVTLINTGTEVFKLVRDSRNTGRFYRGVNSNFFLADVHTQGNCWVGENIQFCAD